MSSRNSKASKEAARLRLREQREKEAKRAKVRRQVLVVSGVVVVLAIVGVGAVLISNANKGSSNSAEWSDAKSAKLVQPANSEGTTIVVGDKNNKNNLDLYEDLRCPACAAFEQSEGAQVLQAAKDGKYKITYHFGTFLDRNQPGTGSKNALSAVGAAVNVSLDAFEQYHTLLYSKAHHPDETTDPFSKDANMIKLAQDIPALKNNAAFNKAVNDGTYDKWALNSSDAFDKAGITSTPTVKLNGVQIKDTTNLVAQIEAKTGVK